METINIRPSKREILVHNPDLRINTDNSRFEMNRSDLDKYGIDPEFISECECLLILVNPRTSLKKVFRCDLSTDVMRDIISFTESEIVCWNFYSVDPEIKSELIIINK